MFLAVIHYMALKCLHNTILEGWEGFEVRLLRRLKEIIPPVLPVL